MKRIRRCIGGVVVLMVTLVACGNEATQLDDQQDASGGSGASGGSDGAGAGGSDGSGAGTAVGELGDPLVRLATYGPPGPHYLQSRYHDGVLYVCSARQGLLTFDVSTPASLEPLDELDFSEGKRCQYVAIDEATSHALVSHAEEQSNPQSFLAAVDIANPSALSESVMMPRDEQPAGLDVEGGLVVLAAKGDGLLLFDWDGSSFSELGGAALDEAWNVRLHGSLAYVANGADGLSIVDVSDPSAPVLRGSVDLEGIAKDLVVDGDRAYVALGGEGIAAVDVSDPDAPALLDWEETPGSALAIAYSPEVSALFVSDWNDIRIFDLSDRDDPLSLGHEALPFGPDREARTMGIASNGAYVFSSNWDELASYEMTPGVSAPDLVISPTILQLPNAESGATSTGALLLSNEGPRELAISEINVSGGLELSSYSAIIAPFATASVEVTYTATNGAPFDGSVTVVSDDIDQPTQSVDVTANQPGLGVGDEVPDWSYFDLVGNQISLSQYDGSVVMLAYFATF